MKHVRVISTPTATKGGAGSGNFGHEGRPGEVGGSGGGGGGGEATTAPTREMLYRAHAVFDAFQEHTLLSNLVDRQMRGGVMRNGRFTAFNEQTKYRNLVQIVREIDSLRENDPEAFEQARQWDLAERMGVKEYAEIPDEITVYRGHSEDEGSHRVLNVTHIREVAESFGSTLSEYRIAKDKIVFSLANSVFDEGELIVRTRDLKKSQGKSLDSPPDDSSTKGDDPKRTISSPEANEGEVSSLSKDERDFRRAVQRQMAAQVDEVYQRVSQGRKAAATDVDTKRWDRDMVEEVRPVWYRLFKQSGDAALKRVRRKDGSAVEFVCEKGGAGSGNFGHEGRPGEVGGSGSGGGGERTRDIYQEHSAPSLRLRPVERKAAEEMSRILQESGLVLSDQYNIIIEHGGTPRGADGSTRKSGKDEYSIRLAERPTQDRTGILLHEYGHAVDYVLGQKYHGSGTWSETALSGIRENVSGDILKENFAEMFHHYARYGESRLFFPDLDRSRDAKIEFLSRMEEVLQESFPSFHPKTSVVDRIQEKKSLKGGAGSGNFGHAGRPGEVGGSGGGGGGGLREGHIEERHIEGQFRGWGSPGSVFHGSSSESIADDIKKNGLVDAERRSAGTVWTTVDAVQAFQYGLARANVAGHDKIIVAEINEDYVDESEMSSDERYRVADEGIPPQGIRAVHVYSVDAVRRWLDGKGDAVTDPPMPLVSKGFKKGSFLFVIDPVRAMGQQKKSLKAKPRTGSITIPEWVEDPEVLRAIERELFKFAHEIDQTTADMLREELLDGMEQGETIRQLSNRISGLSDEWVEGWRSEMITRTEVARATTVGNIEAWRSTGVVAQKVWHPAGDACPFCLAMEGVAVGLDENFLDEGDTQEVEWRGQDIEMAQGYGDVKGPPLHPNCRCVLVAELAPRGEKMLSEKGGAGSGNFGHEGRPGEVGGSGGGSGGDTLSSTRDIPMRSDLEINIPDVSVRVSPTSTTRAWFDPEKNEIVLPTLSIPHTQAAPAFGKQQTDQSLTGIARHEIAHLLIDRNPSLLPGFERAATGISRNAWAEVSRGSARGDSEERFAECFAAFSHPGYDGGLPEKIESFFASRFPKKKGGAGSGNFGHAGRLGEVGGSGGGGGGGKGDGNEGSTVMIYDKDTGESYRGKRDQHGFIVNADPKTVFWGSSIIPKDVHDFHGGDIHHREQGESSTNHFMTPDEDTAEGYANLMKERIGGSAYVYSVELMPGEAWLPYEGPNRSDGWELAMNITKDRITPHSFFFGKAGEDWVRFEKKSLKGGSGSGNFGHEGRPGMVGGSGAGGSAAVYDEESKQWITADGKGLPEHIASIRIPPAWTAVEYNSDPDGDLLVRGKDSKGRTQSVYSATHWERAAMTKFTRTREILDKWDAVSAENEAMRKDPASREEADCAKLIMQTGIRPGSETDTGGEKQAYGATTLEGKHVVEADDGLHLKFVGKKGVNLDIPVKDKGTADMIRSRAKEAGEDGKLFNTSDKKLLAHTHKLDGGKMKTKDFRTAVGTKTARDAMNSIKSPSSQKEYERAVRSVAKTVSERLGNTPTVALQSYIDPLVFAKWRDPAWGGKVKK